MSGILHESPQAVAQPAAHMSTPARGWSRLRPLVGVCVVAALAVGGWFASDVSRPQATPSAERTPIAVSTGPVAPRPVRRVVTVVGSLFGRDELAIAPKVDGRVVKVHHDIGDVVRPGDILLELDPTDYALAVAEARRELDLALARIGMTKLPSGAFDVSGLPSVVRTVAQEKNAAERRDRLRQARVSGAASADETDKAEADSKVAAAEARQAVIDAQAALAAARQRAATLDTAEQKLKDTRIVVPGQPGSAAEYVVTARAATEGEIVYSSAGSNTSLFRLVIDRTLKLQAAVPERHRGEIRLGQDVSLEVEAHPGIKFSGQVARVNPAIDRASRTFTVEVHVPNGDRRLGPGSFARAEVLVRVDPAAPTVPQEAVVSFAGVTKVFAVRDGKAAEVRVRPGVTIEVTGPSGPRLWTEVEGDLRPGEAVAVTGHDQLADGTPVRARGVELTKTEGGR